jgi:hypothetical protein
MLYGKEDIRQGPRHLVYPGVFQTFETHSVFWLQRTEVAHYIWVGKKPLHAVEIQNGVIYVLPVEVAFGQRP